jgi:hypothetical protein
LAFLNATSRHSLSTGENKLAADVVDIDVLGVEQFSVKNLLAELVFDFALNGSTQWSCSKRWVEANLD